MTLRQDGQILTTADNGHAQPRQTWSTLSRTPSLRYLTLLLPFRHSGTLVLPLSTTSRLSQTSKLRLRATLTAPKMKFGTLGSVPTPPKLQFLKSALCFSSRSTATPRIELSSRLLLPTITPGIKTCSMHLWTTVRKASSLVKSDCRVSPPRSVRATQPVRAAATPLLTPAHLSRMLATCSRLTRMLGVFSLRFPIQTLAPTQSRSTAILSNHRNSIPQPRSLKKSTF